MNKNMTLAACCISAIALALSACDDSSASSATADDSKATATVASPALSYGVAYYGTVGSMDSLGTSVSARLLVLVQKDSTFKMYISPVSLPLYHARSSLDLFRLNGKLTSINSASGTMSFVVDSATSFWNTGIRVRQGTVSITADSFYPNSKYVMFNFLSTNGEGVATSEFSSISSTDSNAIYQSGLSL